MQNLARGTSATIADLITFDRFFISQEQKIQWNPSMAVKEISWKSIWIIPIGDRWAKRRFFANNYEAMGFLSQRFCYSDISLSKIDGDLPTAAGVRPLARSLRLTHVIHVVNGINKISLLSFTLPFTFLFLSPKLVDLLSHSLGSHASHTWPIRCIWLLLLLLLVQVVWLIFLFLLSPFINSKMELPLCLLSLLLFRRNVIHMCMNVCINAGAHSCHRINKMYDLYLYMWIIWFSCSAGFLRNRREFASMLSSTLNI